MKRRFISVVGCLCLSAAALTAWLPSVSAARRATSSPAESTAATSTTSASATSTASAPAFPAAPPGAIITAEGWFAPPDVKKPALPQTVTRAFVIPIREPITTKTYEAIKRKIHRCRAGGAQLVVFDMATPGGEMGAMSSIAQRITDDLGDVYTVAYVDPRAYSAGAVISLACNEIVMAPNAVIGDAMPIMISSDGTLAPMPKEERGKFESAGRAEVRKLAQRNGYSIALCEGMITLSLEVWLVRRPDTGQLMIVNAAEFRGQTTNPPPTTGPAVEHDANSPWLYARTIDGPDTLVTMTTQDALRIGFIQNVFTSMTDLAAHFHYQGPVEVLTDTWSETMVEFLTSPTVTGLLMLVGMLCIYLEFHSGGFGAAAIVGILCFSILFGSHYLIGMADWWEIALFVVGLILIALELFVLPGFGVPGILGILCCIVGLVVILIPHAPDKLPIPSTAIDWRIFTDGLFGLGAGFVGAVVAMFVLSRILPKVPVAGRLILAPVHVPPDTSLTDDSPLRHLGPGDIGVVENVCKPVGKVRFGDHLVDASADGGILDPGTRVRVLRREGNQLFVEKA